jgi:hypothetical protein
MFNINNKNKMFQSNRELYKTSTNREIKLKQVNQELQEIIESEVAINRSNEKYINKLERKYIRCENEVQSLNKELERLENISEEKKTELRSEISRLHIQIYNAKKEI